jgi:hypothetical protein
MHLVGFIIRTVLLCYKTLLTGPYKTLHNNIIFKKTHLFCLEVGLQSAYQCSL